jgi:hypothetical protein
MRSNTARTRSLALVQVNLEVVGDLLLERPSLVDGHRLVVVKTLLERRALHAHEPEQRLEVGVHTRRRGGATRHAEVLGDAEVDQLVRERRYVATFADEDVQSALVESAAGWAGRRHGLLKQLRAGDVEAARQRDDVALLVVGDGVGGLDL